LGGRNGAYGQGSHTERETDILSDASVA
jgi:hypothetical protein